MFKRYISVYERDLFEKSGRPRKWQKCGNILMKNRRLLKLLFCTLIQISVNIENCATGERLTIKALKCATKVMIIIYFFNL